VIEPSIDRQAHITTVVIAHRLSTDAAASIYEFDKANQGVGSSASCWNAPIFRISSLNQLVQS